MIFLLLLGAVVHLAVGAKKPTCLITAPNIIHLGEEETVSVQLHGATKPVTVVLYFRHENQKVLSDRKTVTLNGDNQYQAVVQLGLYSQTELHKRRPSERYVQLAAQSADLFDKQVRLANILLSTRRGHIFIQTDKPIYNPGQHVKFRIYTLNNYLLPVDEAIHVQIFNCQGLVVYSRLIQSKQILESSTSIPDVELAGHWNITASYSNYPESITSTAFEVREYVLPLFEVNIQASKPYHTLNTDRFPFTVSARYTYGKGVSGIAYVRFGLVDRKGERTYLPGIEKQTAVMNGTANLEVLTAELQSAAANQSMPDIEGMYLYIAATVLEKASGDLEEAESSSVKIAASPYVVDLSKTKPYFTPGGLFSILGTITHPDGSRVKLVKVKAAVTMTPAEQGKRPLTEETWGDEMGDIVITFPVPQLTRQMTIEVSVMEDDAPVIAKAAQMTSTAINPEQNSYLSVEVQHQVLQPGQNLRVKFKDITPPGSAKPSHIYYMVVSKGKVLKVSRVERTDQTTVSLPFSEDMVPSFRLVGYYYIEPEGTKIVADSVWVDVKDVCKGKIEIAPLGELKPAQQFEVLVNTEPDSRVALSAVDSAVYILNKKNKLSPQKMFEYMNSYDLACSIGGGEDSLSVLQRVGLTFICNSGAVTPRLHEHKCYNKPHRLKRDVEYSKLINSFKHPDRKCCDDGRKLGLMLKSCAERLKQTTHQPDSCRQAFKRCCEAATARRKKEMLQRMRLNLGRASSSTEENDLIDEASIHLRSYFPETWMWVLLEPDASGKVRHSTVTPDSITTWEVQATGMSPTRGFCIADPKPLRVFQDFFVSVKLPYTVKRNEQLELKAVVYNYRQETLEQVKVKMHKAEGLCSAGEGDVVQEVTVPGQSAVAVYFTVVPLIIGRIPISVLAYASDTVKDRIQKELRVVLRVNEQITTVLAVLVRPFVTCYKLTNYKLTSYKLTNYILTSYKLTNYILTSYKLTNYKLTSYKLTNYILTSYKLTNYILTSYKLTNYTLTSYKLTNYKLTSYKLTNYTLTSYKLTNYILTSYKLTNYTLTSYKLTNYTLTSYKLTNYILTSYKLTNYTLTSYKLTNYILTSYKLTNYKLTSYKLTNYILTSYKLTNYKLTSYKLTNYTLTSYKLTNYKLTSYKLTNYTLTSYKLTNYTLTSYKLTNYTLTSYKLTNYKLTSYKLTNYTLTSYKLTNYILTSYKLTNYTLTSYKLTNYTLTSYKLTNYILTSYKLTNYTLTSYKLTNYTLTSYKLTNYIQTSYKLTNYTLTSYKLTNYILTSYKLTNYTLTSYKLTNYKLTSYKLTNYTLTTPNCVLDSHIQGEGELVSIQTQHTINAKSEKKLEFDIPAPEDQAPGQDSSTHMSLKGGVMGESVDNCLNLEGVDNLIQLPTGCAEQTMVKMSPAIHAIKYLDATHQWLFLKAERRDEAQSMIQSGYNRVLTYKKQDGSYGAFLKTPSSNWLTAFIAKELTQARAMIEVRELYIEEAMAYLISKQKASGAWDDPNPLYDKGMKGGVGQAEDDVPLTAYILLAMKYAHPVYDLGTDTELIMAMNKARSYLVQNLDSLQSPYAMAITAYALSLNAAQSSEAREAHRKLMAMAECDMSYVCRRLGLTT
ncbi:hypothetical protein NFI96_018588 [Prochilodus magdalenae]|nr:hypothetical protein NFI96_018588 [Prochilodus magdalenae]